MSCVIDVDDARALGEWMIYAAVFLFALAVPMAFVLARIIRRVGIGHRRFERRTRRVWLP